MSSRAWLLASSTWLATTSLGAQTEAPESAKPAAEVPKPADEAAEAPKPAAETPKPATEAPKPAAAADEQSALEERERASLARAPEAPHLGDGFHLFDRNYVLFGLNTQRLCQAATFEFEASFVPWISEGMFWGGLYAAGGVQRARRPDRQAPSETESCFEGTPLPARTPLEDFLAQEATDDSNLHYTFEPVAFGPGSLGLSIRGQL